MFIKKYDHDFIIYLIRIGIGVQSVALIANCSTATVRRVSKNIYKDIDFAKQHLGDAYATKYKPS